MGGLFLNTLWDNIRTEIVGLMRWYPNNDQEREEEEHGSPSTGAEGQKGSQTRGVKRKRSSGQWRVKHMPWEVVEEEDDRQLKDGDSPPRNALDTIFRQIMHHAFGHQSWALHTCYHSNAISLLITTTITSAFASIVANN